MKKIFFVAIAATLLAAGCQKTEVLNQVNPVDGSAMTFAPGMGKLTKAATNPSDAGLATLKEQGFHLWAYYVEKDDSRVGAEPNTIYDGMKNIAVTFESEWSTNPIHFWPGKNKALKFFAVSADEEISKGFYGTDDNPNIIPDVTETSQNYGGLTITSFTVKPEDPSSDLMVADYLEQDQDDDLKVALNFRHALSKVEFWFKNEKAPAKEDETLDPKTQVWVQHVEVKEVANVGSLTVAKEPNTETGTRFSWTTSGNANFIAQYSEVQSEDDILKDSDYTSTNDADNYATVDKNSFKLPHDYTKYATWLVIPQNLTANNKTLQVEIVYVIGDRQFVSKFPLATKTVNAWDPNQYIKYNINLSPNIIGFNPTVEEWVTDPSNGADIN